MVSSTNRSGWHGHKWGGHFCSSRSAGVPAPAAVHSHRTADKPPSPAPPVSQTSSGKDFSLTEQRVCFYSQSFRSLIYRYIGLFVEHFQPAVSGECFYLSDSAIQFNWRKLWGNYIFLMPSIIRSLKKWLWQCSTLGLGWIAGSTQRHWTGWFLALVNNEHLSPAAAPGDQGSSRSLKSRIPPWWLWWSQFRQQALKLSALQDFLLQTVPSCWQVRE